MSNPLPPAGTHRLLELVAPYIPDAFIDEVCPRQFTGGRRCQLSAPQLWRTHLLALLTSTHSLNLVVAQLPEQPAWRRFCRLRRHWPGVRMLHEFRQRIGVSGLRRVNQHLLEGLLRRHGVQPHAVALIDATDLPAACNGFKKKHRHLYSLRRGLGRSHAQDRAEPLVCWLQETYLATLAADASSLGDVVAVGQLAGSGQRERGRFVVAEPALVPATFGMVARIVVADMGYLSAESKKAARENWQTAVVTKLRADMKLVPPYVTAQRVECPQGQLLEWSDYEPETSQQWFRVAPQENLCGQCWEKSHCPRQFGFAVASHETLFGLLPLVSRPAQRLLRQVRPWIEPAQSFEKNQLGLSQMFFNSLRLAWQMSLWADSAVLLRIMAWLDTPAQIHPLAPLLARQMELGLDDRKINFPS